MLVAGNFSALGGTTRHGIARLNLDGSIDATFDPGAGPTGNIAQVAQQSDGKIIIVGAFNTVGVTSRNGIARLNTDGSLDMSFDPGDGPAGSLSAVAMQPDGKILAGGNFHSFNGDPTRGELVRLNSDGSVDTNFLIGSGLNNSVSGILLQGNGQIVISGSFTSVNGVTRRSLARLNADGTLDTGFDPGSGMQAANSAPAAFQSSGKLIVEGTYSAGAAGFRSGLFRLNTDGSIDLSFNAGSGFGFSSFPFAVASDDSIVVGGSFTTVDGLDRQYAVRLLPDGGVDPLFNPGTALIGAVSALTLQTDGKAVVAPAGMSVTRLLSVGAAPPPGPAPVVSTLTDESGVRLMWTAATFVEGYKIERSSDGISNWTLVATTSGERILRHYDGGLGVGVTAYYRVKAFNRYGDGPASAVKTATTQPTTWPGQVNLSLDPVLGGVVGPLSGSGYVVAPNACIVQPDGKIIAAIIYQQNSSAAQQSTIVRLNPDGSLDQLYDVSTGYSTLLAMALQPDGKLLIGGNFNTDGGTQTHHLARFNVNGSRDSTFGGDTDGNNVYSIVLQPDGKIFVGGYFQHVSGGTQNGIARLNADGSLDTSFNPGAGAGSNGAVQAMALDASGRLMVGGSFYTMNGHAVGNLARLNSDGSFDSTFNTSTGANNTVTCLALQSNGQVLVGGSFSTYNGSSANRYLVRLNGNGSLDSSFSFPSSGGQVTGLLLQADGRMLIAAPITVSSGGATQFVTRLMSSGAIDPTFNIGLSANLTSLCFAPGGRLIGSGKVTLADGTVLSGLVGLNMTGGAPPPFSPSGVTVKAVPGVQLQVTWADTTGETGYFIERSSNGSTGWGQVGQSAMDTPTFTDSGLTQNTRYYYRVRAFNASGVSLPSGSAYGDTASLPAAPSAFTTRAYGYSEVILNWATGSNNSSLVIERSVDGVSGWIQLATLSPLAHSYMDTGLSGQTGYYYRVRALNTIGDTVSSTVVGTTTMPSGSVVAGSLDPTFTPGAGLQGYFSPPSYPTGVNSILVQTDGKIIIAGEFATYAGVGRKNIARLNVDGSLDLSFDPSAANCLYASQALLQPDAKVLVAGLFRAANGSSVYNIVRLNSDGSVDSTFNATATISSGITFYYGVNAMCLQPDGRILAGYNGLVRLNADGSKDSSFASQLSGDGLNPTVVALASAADGHVFVSGYFSYVNNTARSGFARLNSDGSLDTTFVPGNIGALSSWTVSRALLVQPDGKVLRGNQQFVSTALSRYNSDGSFDAAFTPPAISYQGILYAMALQADGKILVGGNFTTMGGSNYTGIARLNANGSIDTTFDSGLGEIVTALTVQQDGGIVIGGSFTTIENQPRSCIARLLGDPVTWDAFQVWKIGYAINPSVADGSVQGRDGLSVLAEYALGGNPSVVNGAILPAVAMTSQNLSLTYNKLRSDVDYLAEVSTDLVHWTTNGVNQGGIGPNVTASVPTGGGQNLFIRLRFTRP